MATQDSQTGGFASLIKAGALEQAGIVSMVAREEAEIKGAIIVARKFPRDEAVAFAALMRSCERPSFAENAAYSFPRGGSMVTGPAVDLAREACRCWGNMRYGLRIVSADDNWIHIKGWALDLERNNYVEAEDRFKRLIYRKKGGWIEPDERDLRELINRRGAICVRNAVLQVLPPDLIDEALRTADATLTKAASGEIKQTIEESRRRLVAAFAEFGVNGDMIAKRLGHPVDAADEKEIAELRKIYKGLKDGVSERAEFFELGDSPDDEAPAIRRLDTIIDPVAAGPIYAKFKEKGMSQGQVDRIASNLLNQPKPPTLQELTAILQKDCGLPSPAPAPEPPTQAAPPAEAPAPIPDEVPGVHNLKEPADTPGCADCGGKFKDGKCKLCGGTKAVEPAKPVNGKTRKPY